MNEFKKYRRTQIAEMRGITQRDVTEYRVKGAIEVETEDDKRISVSISDVDRRSGSPKVGDMIARNPKNHLDQWLVAKDYFEDNFEEMEREKMNEEQLEILRKMSDQDIQWVQSQKMEKREE